MGSSVACFRDPQASLRAQERKAHEEKSRLLAFNIYKYVFLKSFEETDTEDLSGQMVINLHCEASHVATMQYVQLIHKHGDPISQQCFSKLREEIDSFFTNILEEARINGAIQLVEF